MKRFFFKRNQCGLLSRFIDNKKKFEEACGPYQNKQ
jgi:hypothetical protein